MARSRSVWVVAGMAAVGAVVAAVLLTPGEAEGPARSEPTRSKDVRPDVGVAGDEQALEAIGPRLISDQSDTPVWIYGRGFTPGLRLQLGADQSPIPTHFVDEGHLTAVVPEGLEPDGVPPGGAVEATLVDSAGRRLPGTAPVTIVRDTRFAVPTDMVASGDGERLFVVSPPTDTLHVVATSGGAVTTVAVGDGPCALALWTDGAGVEQLVVAHRFEPALWLVPTGDPSASPRKIPGPTGAQDVAVDGDVAFVTSHVTDAVHRLDLNTGEPAGDPIPVGVNPRAVAVGSGGRLAVSNAGSNDLSLFDPRNDQPSETRIVASGTTTIVGGRTARFQRLVMGSKSARDVLWARQREAVFVTSVGPNIGPNPERWDVSMNGGVGIVDPAAGRFVRHVALPGGVGVPERMALDRPRRVLYVSDVATGRVVAFDAAALAGSDETARDASLAEHAIPPPDEARLIRTREELDSPEWRARRTGAELHSGPWALAIAPDGERLWVLCRFTGVVEELDVSQVRGGRIARLRTLPLAPLRDQSLRRVGEILYHTDVGRTGMTCDGCHPGGHDDGVLFTKRKLPRIYKSPTVRGSRDTVPHFTPIRFPTMADTARIVMGRNRSQNPVPTGYEVQALTRYAEQLTTLPNPFVGERGAPPETLELPDGRTGAPLRGLAVFQAKECATCHPPPLFTLDQDPATRGRLMDVGTPNQLPLRLAMQDTRRFGTPPPSLVQGWDNFPMLLSGAGGFGVRGDELVVATHPFALGRVLELGRRNVAEGRAPHGRMAELTDAETADLLAYLMTL